MWPVSQIKRTLHERRAKYEAQTAEQQAAWRTANATVWIAIFTIVLAGVGGITLYEVIAGGSDTHELAVQAKNQADRMKDLADRMKDQADGTKTIAEQAVVQARAATSAATTTSNTLGQMKLSFVTEQRPYVIATSPIFVRLPAVDGQPINANVTFKNIGRTPAIKRITELDLLRFRPLPKPDPQGIEKFFRFLEGAFSALNKKANTPGGKYARFAREDVAPGAEPFSTAENNTPITTEEFKDLQTGDLVLYLIGITRYTDGFKGKYQTDFCWFYFGSNPKTWHICDSHNVIK